MRPRAFPLSASPPIRPPVTSPPPLPPFSIARLEFRLEHSWRFHFDAEEHLSLAPLDAVAGNRTPCFHHK